MRYARRRIQRRTEAGNAKADVLDDGLIYRVHHFGIGLSGFCLYGLALKGEPK